MTSSGPCLNKDVNELWFRREDPVEKEVDVITVHQTACSPSMMRTVAPNSNDSAYRQNNFVGTDFDPDSFGRGVIRNVFALQPFETITT